MIYFLTGKPGGGKGLMGMRQIIRVLRKTDRPIITNLAVKLDPWVDGDHNPKRGLAAYLRQRYGKDFDCHKRVHVLTHDEIEMFYLYRVVDGVLKKADCTMNAKGDRVMDFDMALAASSGPHLYMVDEAWAFYGSRNWQKTGEALLSYAAQNRKFGDDVFICTQHTKQIDSAIHRVAQSFWVMKNHGLMRIGIWRQPDIFTLSIFDDPPTGASMTATHTQPITLDKNGIAQTYDTSSGVGLVGAGMADMGAKKSGLPAWTLPLGIVMLGVAAWLFIRGTGHVFMHGYASKSTEKGKAYVHSVAQEHGLGDPSPVDDAHVRRYGPESGAATAGAVQGDGGMEVFCTGVFTYGRHVKVFLSDGSVGDSDEGMAVAVFNDHVTVNGHAFRRGSNIPVAPDVPAYGSGQYQYPSAATERQVMQQPQYDMQSVPAQSSVQVIPFGQSYAQHVAPRFPSGFQSMPGRHFEQSQVGNGPVQGQTLQPSQY